MTTERDRVVMGTAEAIENPDIQALIGEVERLRGALWACKSGLLPHLDHPYRSCNPGMETKCFTCAALAHFWEADGVMYEEQIRVSEHPFHSGESA